MIGDYRSWVRGVLISAVSAAAVLFGYRFVFPADWPWWVSLSLTLATVAVILGLFFLRRFWNRGNDHRISAAQEARMANAVKDEKVGLKFLHTQWAQAIDFIRRSHLKKKGDPLYVLPWYMIVGEKGSGKTLALQSARLSSFAESRERTGLSPTQAVEWSFFEQAIVIDTAGRYLSPSLTDVDREEWQRLLDLLFKYRKKESLNGLVVAVSADKLLASSIDALEQAGQNTRQRIDELMRALGAKFPVYLLVTQCDKLRGMAGFSGPLSGSASNQPMGCLNSEMTGSAVAFADQALSTLAEQLKRLRLVLLHRPGARTGEAEALLFPEDFSTLQKGLAAYIRGAFQENAYQETPLLRGLFFSSAKADASRGFFLHDFFAKVLPADRALFVPTQRAVEWKQGTLNMGLVLWLVLAIAWGGLMTYSFAKNLSLLREADREFARLPSIKGDSAADIVALDSLNQAIFSLARKSQGRWLNAFGLHEAGRVQKVLKEKLSAQFRRDLLVPFDSQSGKEMASLGAYSSDIPLSQYIEHLVGRIRLIRARLRGDTLEDGDQNPPTIPALTLSGYPSSPEIKQKFAELYLSSVFWTPDRAALTEEMGTLQTRLKRLLMLKAGSPQWVIAWAKSQNTIPPVTLRDYWEGDGSSVNGEASVSAIFSRKCKSSVDSFFGEIETALGDPDAYQQLKTQFERWYRQNAMEAWNQFVGGFSQGKRRLRTRDAWRQMAARIPKDEGPYFALLNTVALELEPFAGSDAPRWLQDVLRVQPPKVLSSQKALSRLGLQKLDRDANSRAAILEALAAYRKALDKVMETVIDPSQVMSATAQAFQEGSGPGSSPFAAAFTAFRKLRDAMSVGGSLDPAVERVLVGPLDFLWEYARKETADRLQTEWEQKVLAQAAGYAKADAASALLMQDGGAIRFAKEQASAFLEWKPGRGYFSKTAFGGTVPFTGTFLAFVNSSAKVSMATPMNNVNVTITALAPETNPGSKRIPHSTVLELNCGGNQQVLAIRRQRLVDQSFNIAQKSFAWSPSCSDLTLEIDIGSSRLMKVYPGKRGFFDFLKDFDGGTRTFTPAEFPIEAAALSQMGIEWIMLPYRFVGAPAHMPEFTEPDPVPSRIVQGWGG